MTRPRFAAVVALAALLCAGGACELVDPEDPERDALESARNRWDANGPASYRTTQMHVCFCGEEVRGPVTIRVAASGTTRTYVSDGRAVPASYEQFFPTIAQLFDEIERALDEDAHDVQATYDARTGAPLEVFIDWEERTADEEQGWNLTPPEPL